MGTGSPVPGLFQLLAAISEFGGGIAWILGLRWTYQRNRKNGRGSFRFFDQKYVHQAGILV
jgi:hypothetical protein